MLAGRYRLEQQLGAGVDGSLWRAVDETLERPVTVRVVSPGHPFAADVVDAARRAALVDDARLARVLDVGDADGTTYIVTEYVQGRPFEDFLRNGPLPAETVRRIVGETAQALERAGARGLHHLRLTPASVCIVPDGSIKLLGTAIEAAAAGVEHDKAEVASRQDAVGLVSLIYAGLTGRWPGVIDGPLGPAPLVSGRAVPPGDLAAGVPADLDALCVATLGPGHDGPRTPAEVAGQLSPWAAATPMTDPRGIELTAPDRPRATAPGDASASNGEAWFEAADTVIAARPAPAPAPAPAEPKSAPQPKPDPQPQPEPEVTISLDAPDRRDEGAEEPFPVRNAGLQPPLMQAPAFPVPAERAASGRVSALDSGGQAWPTPPAAGRTTVATPPGTTVPRGGLVDDILGAAGAPGVRRLDPAPPPTLGQPARPSSWGGGRDDDRLGPFMPPVPIDRPPQGQTRLVLGLISGLVVLGLLLSLLALRGLMNADPLTPKSSDAPSVAASAKPTASGAAAPVVTGTPVEIAGVKVLDPMGDQTENNAAAPRLIDSDSTTEWRSERYDSARFGGLNKTGIGFVLDLGDVSTVSQVVVEHRGTGGVMELRTGTGPTVDGSTLVSTVPMEGSRLTVTLQQPVSTRYLVFWFTSLTKQSTGEYRMRVFEVSVR
ncbi:MAG: hypothetical protein U0Q19_11410 [Kineosporiaceae bacterium]